MRRLLIFGAIFVAFASPGAAEPPQAAGDRATSHARAAFAQRTAEIKVRYGVPALTVAVGSSEALFHLDAIGLRRLGSDQQVTVRDAFHIGSVTKPITATLIGTMVDRGELRWDSTPAQLWPEWASAMHSAVANVTVEELLGHRAGLAAYTSDEEKDPVFPGSIPEQRAAFAKWITSRPPAFKRGEHQYSNAGYGLVAAMAERVTGRSWEELVRERIFRPLSMTTCGTGWPALRPRQPSGHRRRNDTYVPHDLSDGYTVSPLFAPAGDLHCSAQDLFAFGRAHLLGLKGEHPLLKKGTFERLHKAPAGGDYALGWNIAGFGDYHLGSAGTQFAILLVSPQRDLVMFAAVNGYHGSDDMDHMSSLVSAALKEFGLPKPPGSAPPTHSR